jgi:integrase/recombinase XerC
MAESRSLVPQSKTTALKAKVAVSELLRSFLEGRKETTFRTYRQALAVFARFLDVDSVEAACERLLSCPHGLANKMGLDYKNWLIAQGFSAATVNNRLAALRAVVDMGRTVGMVSWELEVKSLKEEKYRDTAGPGEDQIIQKIKVLGQKKDPKSARDAVILALMGVMGLRRGEVIKLDVGDLDGDQIRVLGKGKTEVEPVTLPPEVLELMEKWIAFRGWAAGPLFLYFRGRKMFNKRLSDRSVGRITTNLDLGHAHGLRHSAITQALDDNQGDLRKVARFSRHKNIQTLIKYDDNRKDFGGEVAKGLAKKLR